MGEDASISFGIRMLAGEMSAWGHFGQSIGEVESNPQRINKILIRGINTAYARAIANANRKAEFKTSFTGNDRNVL